MCGCERATKPLCEFSSAPRPESALDVISRSLSLVWLLSSTLSSLLTLISVHKPSWELYPMLPLHPSMSHPLSLPEGAGKQQQCGRQSCGKSTDPGSVSVFLNAWAHDSVPTCVYAAAILSCCLFSLWHFDCRVPRHASLSDAHWFGWCILLDVQLTSL